jgi:4-diphosphocytidyl-2-C-methyl-D-erythritol kinase
MIVFPNGKINLGLSVIEKRKDGFHNVETIMFPVPLKDVLEIIPVANNFQFDMTGSEIDGNPDHNLVVRAYHMINQKHDIGPVHIHLYKAIPTGAGLGGGSSDAAYTILLLNKLFSLGMTIETMENYARQIGSDCAFFIRNKPVLAHQKGDFFTSAMVNLSRYKILIVTPDLSINTSSAYSWINPTKKKIPLKDIIRYPVDEWEGNLINDFEDVVFTRHPELAKIKDTIRSLGAVYTSLTGSGAAVYGIFNENDIPSQNIDFPGKFVWLSLT